MGGGFGGGDDPFAADSSCLVTISGGTVRINAQGDGIDSNGDLVISGGEVYISGPRNGGDGALDYNGSGTISGGIVVACDMGGMSQNFSDGSQCSAMISLNGSGEIRLKRKCAAQLHPRGRLFLHRRELSGAFGGQRIYPQLRQRVPELHPE